MAIENRRGWRAADFGEWWDDHWEEAVVTALPNLAAVTMAFTSDEIAGVFVADGREGPIQVTAFLVALALFVAQWLVYPKYTRKQRKISRLEDKITELERTNASLADRVSAAEVAIEGVRGGVFEDYKKIVRNYLRDLSDEFGFRHTDRATLYYHRDHDGTFVPIEREAGDPVRRTIRRRSYPDTEGCIAEAWRKGHHFEVVPENGDWLAGVLPEA